MLEKKVNKMYHRYHVSSYCILKAGNKEYLKGMLPDYEKFRNRLNNSYPSFDEIARN